MERTQQLPGLDDFLTALHFEGLPIGPQELVWLQHVFSLEPSLDRQNLHDLLACVLLKDASHRVIFEALFDDWGPFDDSAGATAAAKASQVVALASAAPVPQARVTEPPPPSIEPAQPATLIAATIFGIPGAPGCSLSLSSLLWVLGYALVEYRAPEPRHAPLQSVTPNPVEPPPQLGATALVADPVAQFWTWIPTFDVPPPLVSPIWLALALAALALCGGACLWWRYHRRNAIPDPEASPDTGPAWLPLFAPAPSEPVLLNRDELRAAVWGVEHFVSEDETRAVDLDHTVAATAQAGGLPTVHFAPAVYPREIWLWRDAMVQDPTLERVLAELESSLSLAGLPLRVGTFVDTPALVRWRDGQELSALVLEGHRQSALVVLLTDGYGMQLAAQSELEKHALANLLRAFGEWPRLTFVDCSYGAYGLATRVQAYGLRCIAPEDIPTSPPGSELVRSRPSRRAETVLLGDLRVWAAATALVPDPVSDDSALELQARLGLELSPWTCRDLLRAAESVGDRLGWSPEKRAELLNWLTQCSQEHGKVTEASPLARALDYWIERYRDASTQREAYQSLLLPWQHTPTEQRWRMEMAVLELWRQPLAATTTLYRLRRALGQEICERLALLAD